MAPPDDSWKPTALKEVLSREPGAGPPPPPDVDVTGPFKLVSDTFLEKRLPSLRLTLFQVVVSFLSFSHSLFQTMGMKYQEE